MWFYSFSIDWYQSHVINNAILAIFLGTTNKPPYLPHRKEGCRTASTLRSGSPATLEDAARSRLTCLAATCAPAPLAATVFQTVPPPEDHLASFDGRKNCNLQC